MDQSLGPCQSIKRCIWYQYYQNNDESFNCNGDQFLRYVNPTTTAKIFDANGSIPALPPDAHPIDANHDAEYLWTTYTYTTMIITPIIKASILDYVIDGDGPELSGSDGSDNIISRDRASAYCVQVGSRRFGGTVKCPPP